MTEPAKLMQELTEKISSTSRAARGWKGGGIVKITVSNTDKLPGETFEAEPLPTEYSWRVISSRGRLVMFRVSEETAKKFASDMNAKETGREGE